jgi:small subunit ribosomal protein S17
VEEQVVQGKSSKRSFVGVVTSDKMDKTIVVQISTKATQAL